jgi:hypothetical protein
MRKLLFSLATLAAVALLGGGLFLAFANPRQRPASQETVARTPERMARGRYLVEHVLDCNGCHTQRDWSRWGGPMRGARGAGGDCLTGEHGFPGRICGSNITMDRETGIGAWTDGEILRATREGVDREGEALFPLMPYTEYRALSEEDARAVLVYLRTFRPVRHAMAETEIDFPVRLFVKMAPRDLDGPVLEPDRSDPVHYGEYLATISGCKFCHTPVDDRNQPVRGQAFAGGQEFRGPWGTVRSSNLTPHVTGLGERGRESFIGLFRVYNDPGAAVPAPAGRNTVMPWLSLAGMTDDDLGAIYDYLLTVPPIESTVERFPPAPKPAA